MLRIIALQAPRSPCARPHLAGSTYTALSTASVWSIDAVTWSFPLLTVTKVKLSIVYEVRTASQRKQHSRRWPRPPGSTVVDVSHLLL